MSTGEHIVDLMIRWETGRREGRLISARELCAECPHLVEQLQQRIGAVLRMEKVLGVTGTGEATVISESSPSAVTQLPEVPGFKLLRLLDQGGMGVVFLAQQLDLGRTVALKMISSVQLNAVQRARFRAEAESAARLQHPNCVQIFQVGEVNGRPYFSMEYVDGGSLSGHLDRSKPFVRRAAEVVEILARAVQAAHDCGIVHRDLKPANVLLTASGAPKITDFGLAKRLGDTDSATKTGEVLGTPCYMAPEQAEGKRDLIGPLTDVYGLGTILYELLTGRPPFRGDTTLDTIRKVASEEPVPPTRLTPSVPRDLDAICLKCLEKSPSRRYASARELGDDLHRFLRGLPVRARHIGPLRRTGKLVRRHPQWTAVIVMASVLALLGGLVWLQDHRKQQAIQQRAESLAPQVREILQRNCYECHGADSGDIKKDLDVLDHTKLIRSKRHIVVGGHPDDSRLIKRIADGSMPPEEDERRLPRLSGPELTILRDWILGGAPPLPPEDAARPTEPVVAYSALAADVKKIFEMHCYRCHKFDVAKGGVKILHHRLLVDVRKVVVPYGPDKSELYHVITSNDPMIRMPPETPLSSTDIDTIRRWIEEGAAPFPPSE